MIRIFYASCLLNSLCFSREVIDWFAILWSWQKMNTWILEHGTREGDIMYQTTTLQCICFIRRKRNNWFTCLMRYTDIKTDASVLNPLYKFSYVLASVRQACDEACDEACGTLQWRSYVDRIVSNMQMSCTLLKRAARSRARFAARSWSVRHTPPHASQHAPEACGEACGTLHRTLQ